MSLWKWEKGREMTNHVLRANQFDKEFLAYLYDLTNKIRGFGKTKSGIDYLQGLLSHKQAMLYFTQPSTRTFLSFQAACHMLGIRPNEIRDRDTSSELKGESVEDSVRTFSSYVDLIIMRSEHPELCYSSAEMLDQTRRPVSIINAGSVGVDGIPDEHPTQALLDIYTIQKSFGGAESPSGKSIGFVGDLKRGRTIRSLAILLSQYRDVKFYFCAPKGLQIKDDLKELLDARKEENNLEISIVDNLNEILPKVDVLYMTRCQMEYGEVHYKQKDFSLDKECLELMKKDSIIMHPLPRTGELAPEVDTDPRAMYWRQERNGMWVRTALIADLMGAASLIGQPPES